MTKKRLFIILSALVVFTIVAISVWFFISQQNNVKTEDNTSKQSTTYTVDSDSKSYASLAKSAVESYANQNISESIESRNNRLKPYFDPTSPVFSKDIEIRSTNSATKTTATVTSIRYSTEDSDINDVLVVDTKLKSYYGSDSSTGQQRYLVTISSSSTGSYVVYDVEAVEKS